MRVMVFVKATKQSEAEPESFPPAPEMREMFAEMARFNEELVKAGVLLAGDGLKPSSKGKRVRFSGSKRIVIDGPFAETKELVAGYWIWRVQSMDEAIAWVRRCPCPFPGQESEIEIRQIYEIEDFGDVLTPELKEQEERLRAQLAAQHS